MGTDPSKKSQCDKILSYLQSGKTITPTEALSKFGCFRLGARIHDLKGDGHSITTERVKVATADGSTAIVARYSMSGAARKGVSA